MEAFKTGMMLSGNDIKEIKPLFCEQQQYDIMEIINLADEIGHTASGLHTNGSQGIQQYNESRELFKNKLIDIFKNYRYVVK